MNDCMYRQKMPKKIRQGRSVNKLSFLMLQFVGNRLLENRVAR